MSKFYNEELYESIEHPDFFNEEQLNDRRRFIENNDKIGYSKIIRRRYRVYKDLFDEMNNGFIDYSLFKKDDFE